MSILLTKWKTSSTVQLEVSSFSSNRSFNIAGEGQVSVFIRSGELGVSGDTCGTDTSSSSTLISVSTAARKCLLGTVADRSNGDAASAGLLIPVLCWVISSLMLSLGRLTDLILERFSQCLLSCEFCKCFWELWWCCSMTCCWCVACCCCATCCCCNCWRYSNCFWNCWLCRSVWVFCKWLWCILEALRTIFMSTWVDERSIRGLAESPGNAPGERRCGGSAPASPPGLGRFNGVASEDFELDSRWCCTGLELFSFGWPGRNVALGNPPPGARGGRGNPFNTGLL